MILEIRTKEKHLTAHIIENEIAIAYGNLDVENVFCENGKEVIVLNI